MYALYQLLLLVYLSSTSKSVPEANEDVLAVISARSSVAIGPRAPLSMPLCPDATPVLLPMENTELLLASPPQALPSEAVPQWVWSERLNVSWAIGASM